MFISTEQLLPILNKLTTQAVKQLEESADTGAAVNIAQ